MVGEGIGVDSYSRRQVSTWKKNKPLNRQMLGESLNLGHERLGRRDRRPWCSHRKIAKSVHEQPREIQAVICRDGVRKKSED